MTDPDPDRSAEASTVRGIAPVPRHPVIGGYTSERADFAEWFPKADADVQFEPGEVVGLREGQVVASTVGADAAFVVSTAPIMAGNEPSARNRDRHVRLALVGQVPVHVDGPVEAGDRLVAANDRRVATADRPADEPGGASVGLALEEYPHDGPGEVIALVGSVDALPGTASRERPLDGETVPTERADGRSVRGSDDPGEYSETDRIAALERELQRKDEVIADLAERVATLEASVEGEGTDEAAADD